MATIDSIHFYSKTDIDRYWALVKLTMEKLLGGNLRLADDLRHEISGCPDQEQLLFYHTEPLQVAADLVDKRPSKNEVEAYIRLASSEGWYVGWTSP